MGIISNVFNTIIWTVINLLFSFIDAIYSSFVKLNGINIINDLLTKDKTLINTYNYIIVLAVVILGFFSIWNYMKKFLEPDESPPVSQITLEIVKCTLLVILSSFLLSQLFDFSLVFSGAIGNLFKSDNYSFSSSIVSSYVDINEKFLKLYDASAQSEELKKFNTTKQTNINGYIKEIKEINTDLNKYSYSTKIKYFFDEKSYECGQKTISNSNNSNSKTSENASLGQKEGMLSVEDKNTTSIPKLSLNDKINARINICEDLKKEMNKEFEGKSSKFPLTPDKDPFSTAGIDVNDSNAIHNYIEMIFKGSDYSSTKWYKDELWSWYYVVKEGTLGINALDDIVICWGGNKALLLLVGFFLVYAMFFSGIMLARRQLEMLLMFFFSPIIFACSICNKQRRQSLYEQLSSLVIQAGAVMLVLGIGARLISQISILNFGAGLEGLLIKTFFTCGVATLILTGSQAVNRFIGSNVSANSGREALQSMAGFNSALKGVGGTGAIATAGAGVTAIKVGTHPISSVKGAGSFAKNGVSGIVNSAKSKMNMAKSIGAGLTGIGMGTLASATGNVELGFRAGIMEGARDRFKNNAQSFKNNARQNKQNMSNILSTARKNISSPSLTRIGRMNRYGRRYY